MNNFDSNLLIPSISKKIDLYADIKNLSEIIEFRELDFIKGFTTNPTLIKKGGSKNYLEFIVEAVKSIGDLNISIEVIADDFDQMYLQAKKLSLISSKIYVKIPIYNSKHQSSIPLIKRLIVEGCPINITAIFTLQQLEEIANVVQYSSEVIVSIFAGRIADTGIDPIPTMIHAVNLFKSFPKVKVLWASPREILNIIQAIECECDIITAIPEILNKLDLFGKDLDQYSLETVQMFYNDATDSKFSL
jgi:transaldolase